MALVKRLCDAGFSRVVVLDGAACEEAPDSSVLLALWRYEAESAPGTADAWIHPYYFASQQAYMAASAIARELAADGVALRDDIRLKPIFARLPGFSQGRNTLSYVEDFGSRFHVQTLTVTPRIPATHQLMEAPHELHCGDCRRCVSACPTNALEGGVFHRERCIRNWQMSGQPVPEPIRCRMGNSLIGCDVCQRVCPHNSPVVGKTAERLSLETILSSPKEAFAALRPLIGANLSIPNRVLSQACLLAGCSGRRELSELLQPLTRHPSPVVSEHAKWALEALLPSQL